MHARMCKALSRASIHGVRAVTPKRNLGCMHSMMLGDFACKYTGDGFEDMTQAYLKASTARRGVYEAGVAGWCAAARAGVSGHVGTQRVPYARCRCCP